MERIFQTIYNGSLSTRDRLYCYRGNDLSVYRCCYSHTDIFEHYVSVDSPLYGRFNNERYPPARILIIYNVPYPRRKNIMGVNSANYLILPKITALVTFIPILVAFSMFTGLFGGYLVSIFTSIIPTSRYVYGLQSYFNEYYIWYSIIKSLFFGFVISSVASFYGYKVKGGALEVGQASTDSVVVSSVTILLLDVLLTKILLQ